MAGTSGINGIVRDGMLGLAGTIGVVTFGMLLLDGAEGSMTLFGILSGIRFGDRT